MTPVRPFEGPLEASLAEAWVRLERGAADRNSALHVVQIATLGADGAPRLRSVVLRAVDRASRTVRFHTDARSPKVAEIAADARVALLGYDEAPGLQIRIEGVARVLGTGPEADAAWTATRAFSRICYRVARAPSSPIDAPEDGLPPRETSDQEAGRDAFRIVQITARRLEWLHLAADGHRRAEFVFGSGGIEARWLVP